MVWDMPWAAALLVGVLRTSLQHLAESLVLQLLLQLRTLCQWNCSLRSSVDSTTAV